MVITTIIALVVVCGGACVTGVVILSLFHTHTAQTVTHSQAHVEKKLCALWLCTRSSIKKEIEREMSGKRREKEDSSHLVSLSLFPLPPLIIRLFRLHTHV